MKCKKHPKYKAVRKPTSDCLYCWHKWLEKNPHPVDVKDIIEKFIEGKYSMLEFGGVITTPLRECLTNQ
jgi:hypothetical protein